MKRFLLIIFVCSSLISLSESKTIHVFVALCDNVNQGIVPVPKSLGNGQDPKNNLYWGAMYGVKSYFKYKCSEWTLIKSYVPQDSTILERVVFKHSNSETYIVADAYDGAHIKKCTQDFLLATNGQNGPMLKVDSTSIRTGGNADLIAYIGHDGLMEFSVDLTYQKSYSSKKSIMLACISKDYFANEIQKTGAEPLLWTTGLMAPEAYTLEAAIKGWMNKETNEEIKERAAQAYQKFQKCGISGARRLFSTGF